MMEHHVLVVGGFGDKVAAVTRLVDANPRSIVFTRTREGATDLRAALAAADVPAVDLHGNLTQRVRERNLARFADGRAQVVVATDVAARGIHVDGVGLVVHFDPPADPKAYVHRSGRTARAGASGAVVTIVTTAPGGNGDAAPADRWGHGTPPRPARPGGDRAHWTADALGRSGTTAPTRRSSGAARGGSVKGGRGPGGPAAGDPAVEASGTSRAVTPTAGPPTGAGRRTSAGPASRGSARRPQHRLTKAALVEERPRHANLIGPSS